MKIPEWIKNIDRPLDRKISAQEWDHFVSENERLERHVKDLERELIDLKRRNAEAESELEKMIQVADEDVPSIQLQTHFRTGFFHFGKAQDPGVRYYNCGIIDRADGLWLVTRRSFTDPQLPIGRNDVMAFLLDKNSYTPLMGRKVAFPVTHKNQHFEDPRVVAMGNNVFVSATTFQISPDMKMWSGAHQCIGAVNGEWNVEHYYDPIYGYNGGSLGTQIKNETNPTGSEKNWLWFEHDRKPHLVYATDPHHVVVEFQPNLTWPEQEYRTQSFSRLWRHGQARGGTPPVLVGDEYWTFFHSSTPWLGKKRRYHMGALSFEAKPPFAIKRCTPMPILSGSKNDEWYQGLPLVVFPCGSRFKDGQWLVTMGVNDCCSAWIEIPHEELIALTKPTREIPIPEQEAAPEAEADPTHTALDGVAPEPTSSPRSSPVGQFADNADRDRHARKRKPRKVKPAASEVKRG